MWWRTRTRRLEELEDEVASLKRAFGNLELEWSNAYDKLRKIVQRISKRAEIVERAESPGAVPGAESGRANGTNPLSARQQEFNERILARRNRLGGGQTQ